PFGIVPAALMGIDVRALLGGAGEAWRTAMRPGREAPAEAPAAAPAWLWLGAALSALARAGAGADKLTFAVAPPLASVGLWLEQLFAESTGKRHTGILPVADEPLGEPGAYGSDRVFLHIPVLGRDPGEGGLEQAMRGLAGAGHPVITLPAAGPLDLGRLFLLSELAVAVAGWGLEINPFDQPNVQEAKDATNAVLAARGTPQQIRVVDADEEQLRALLAGAAPPQYVALMGYLAPSAAVDRAIARLRAVIRDATHATTTFGYGPRFLHSTGQFHKGGPPTGRFLQLLHDDRPPDVGIPGESYTFDQLKHAQADGDLQTLRRHGLPAERITLAGDDAAAALDSLTTRIAELLGAAPEGHARAAVTESTTSRPAPAQEGSHG
ncbi:MAG: hypothetical protein FWD42_11060, partial [Solirubrobacterales bacterium]|nr:hypothetical protein [Solirubrobacterales bacterium]